MNKDTASQDRLTPEDTKTFADIEWKTATARYSTGSDASINGIKVGSTSMPLQSKDYNGPRWAGHITLPGISLKNGLLFEEEPEAMAAVGRAVRRWFELTAKR